MRTFRRLLALTWVTAIVACSAAPPAAPPVPTATEIVARGDYLVNTSGCHDCHTPFQMGPNGPEPDMTRALSGHPADMPLTRPPVMTGPWVFAGAGTNTAWAGPWGISFTANITSDQNSGLGVWTEDMFLRAIREGKHMGTARPILPPMPWPVYRNMTDEDLKSIFAYLKTVPAVANNVPDPLTPEDVAKMK
jgi:mono/diheme cytochrome c family protein